MTQESWNPRKTEELLRFIPQEEEEEVSESGGLWKQLRNGNRHVITMPLTLEQLREAISEMFYQKENANRGQNS